MASDWLIGTLATVVALGTWPPCLCAQGRPEIVWSTNGGPLSFSSDSILLAARGSERLNVWNITNASLQAAFVLPRGGASDAAYSHDGGLLAAGGLAACGGAPCSFVWLWRLADESLVWEKFIGPGTPPVTAVAFSFDDSVIGYVFGTYSFGLLQAEDNSSLGEIEFLPGDERVFALAFSPIARVLATSHRSTIKLWSYTNGLSEESLLGNLESSATFDVLQFLPGGLELLCWSTNGLVELREIDGGSVRHRFQDPEAGVSWEFDRRACAVSANGEMLVAESGSDKNPKLKVWRICDGALLRTYDQGVSNVSSLAFTADGSHFAYGTTDSLLLLARTPPLITERERSNNQLSIHWRWGSGRYQLQRSESVHGQIWLNVGDPTTNTSATVSITDSNWFFRVQSLPNPP